MERWLAKVLALLVLFIVPFIVILLPVKITDFFLKHGQKGTVILSHLMCFGGGVFLGVYMLHMSPDVKDLLDYALLEPYGISYPLAELIMVSGFFLMIFMEKMILKRQERYYEKTEIKRQATETELIEGPVMTSTPYVSSKDGSSADAKAQQVVLLTNNHRDRENGHQQLPEVTFHHGHSHVHATRSLILLLALSLHHIFEGMSIGLKYDVASIWSLCLAIICHEVVIMFSLGMQLVKTYQSLKKIVFAAMACSLMTPLGVAIGLMITETGGQDNATLTIINGVLQGISTGVFIYITFFEILMEEIGQGDSSIAKLFSMMFGFAVLALLGLLPEDKLPDNLGHLDNSTLSNCTC